MSFYPHVLTWLAAARSEALLARHLQIEELDLFLGLLAQGGEVAQTLGAHGVSLARARQAAAELDDADLAAVGIKVAPGLRPTRLRGAAAVTGQEADLDLSDAATQFVFERQGKVRSDRMTLRSLLNPPTSSTARLLTSLGVPVADLLTTVEQMAPSRDRVVQDVPVPQNYRQQGLQRALRCRRFVSAPPERLQRLVARSELLPQWLLGDSQVAELGEGHLVVSLQGRQGRSRGQLELRLCQEQPGLLAWEQYVHGVRYSGDLAGVHSLRLAPAPGGTLVELTRVTRGFGRLGWLVAPVSHRLFRLAVCNQLIMLAALAADEEHG
ncbi:SRPBCC family protein [Actinomyces trachealis]|uniref:SRPBCC family protein n=1 Tax=Actinomyces trachealis TaxID=2763540 RepID=UPI00189293C0|nr:SRPBCC family protein [Actinomyces trachealis]